MVRAVLTRVWTEKWARARLLDAAIGASLTDALGFFSRNPAGQELKQAVLAAISARQASRRNGDQSALAAAEALRRFGQWRREARHRLADEVFAALPADVQNHIINTHTRLSGKYLLWDDAEKGAVVYDQEGVQVRALGTGSVEVSVGLGLRAEAQLATDLQGYDAWRVVPETMVNKNVLLPLLRWQKEASGHRTWLLIGLGPALIQQFMRQAGPLPAGQEEDVLRWNPVLGPLMVAYLEPELRSAWPERQGLPGGKFQQPMGPAQVPVLALQHREELLRSALIAACERYADRHLA